VFHRSDADRGRRIKRAGGCKASAKGAAAAHAQMLAQIADRKPGDIELVSLSPGGVLKYTLLKVVAIWGDDVTVRVHRETRDVSFLSGAFAVTAAAVLIDMMLSSNI
jgi:hypothetical protein